MGPDRPVLRTYELAETVVGFPKMVQQLQPLTPVTRPSFEIFWAIWFRWWTRKPSLYASEPWPVWGSKAIRLAFWGPEDRVFRFSAQIFFGWSGVKSVSCGSAKLGSLRHWMWGADIRSSYAMGKRNTKKHFGWSDVYDVYMIVVLIEISWLFVWIWQVLLRCDGLWFKLRLHHPRIVNLKEAYSYFLLCRYDMTIGWADD